MPEMPTLMAMNYASQSYAGDDWQKPLAGMVGAGAFDFNANAMNDAAIRKLVANAAKQNPQPIGVAVMPNPSRRLVQVFIADPNDNIPIDDCLLYKGEQRLTDLTDQELFFEVDIKALLAAHNEKRTKVVDKAVKERTEYLEAARVRDLKMVVATLATF